MAYLTGVAVVCLGFGLKRHLLGADVGLEPLWDNVS